MWMPHKIDREVLMMGKNINIYHEKKFWRHRFIASAKLPDNIPRNPNQLSHIKIYF